jgi:putative spermidine/putrescine transport system permease protein
LTAASTASSYRWSGPINGCYGIAISMSRINFVRLCLVPLALVTTAFFLVPMARLMIVGGSGPSGLAAYAAILTEPRYRATLINTIALSAATTAVTLVIATVAGLFLQRNRFSGRAVLIAMLTFPLAFPGVVVGFMIILLAGRQGLIGDVTARLLGDKVVFAYSIQGLFLGYLYFSIPRVILTVMAGIEKLDPALEEAARALGAGRWAVHRDVILPALRPAFVASGAIAFATAMGAFGTAFTLATNIDVLAMLIYTEFTLSANIAMAAALSVGLGLIAWAILAFARSMSGGPVAAAG